MADTLTSPRAPVAAQAPAGARAESIPDLIKEIRDQTTLLLRQEVALARTEVSEKVARLLRNLVYLIGGGLAAFAGLIFVLYSLTAGVGLALNAAGMEEHSLWLAPLLVGLLVMIGGGIWIGKGVSTLKKETLIPEKALGSLKEDKEWMQNKVR